MPSTFGFALDDDELAGIQSALAQVGRLATAEQVSDRVAALVGPVQRDLAIVAATGRWDVDAPLHADYVPGDVVGLRMRHAAVIMGTGAAIVRAGSDAPPLERTDVLPGLSLAAALYDASCYFLPVTSATGIMGSHPPMAADLVGLRLPFPVVAVYFGADLVIPERLMEWPPDLALRLAESRAASQPVVARSPEAASTISLGESIIGDISARGGLLSAVILFADQDYGLADVVGFLVATEGPRPGPRDRYRGAIVGQLSASTLMPLVHNLAAAVAWGNWHAPEAEVVLPGEPAGGAWRSAVRRGQFRRREPRGALAGVRVLDTARMFRPSAGARSDDGRASPIAHLRRGYWQRHRLGPQADWHYELRFHPPVMVNPTGPAGSRLTVYRLPLPPGSDRP